MKIDALIIGGGPTGMTMAIELARAGLLVRIIDKKSGSAEHSQALVVQARTLEQFQRYGVAEEAVDRGRKLTRAHLWSKGRQFVSFNFDNISSRYPYLLFLPQSETESILNARLQSYEVKIERNTELVEFSQEGDTVSASVRLPDGQQEIIATRWLVGCDGAHSVVRRHLNVPFEGKGVNLSFFLGDFELEGSDIPNDELSVHFDQGDIVFLGRLSDRLVRVIVAQHTQHGDVSNAEISIRDFQDAFDKARIKASVKSADWMTPFHVNDRQATRYRVGNAFLAGDASHIHSPVGGQGMNTGIQDAANLGWKLAAVARGADQSILNSYEQERAEVGRALLRFTERGLGIASTINPLMRIARDMVLPIAVRSKSIREAIAGFISETAIEYRASPIVADYGGDGSLRAGDRMPDLTLNGDGRTSTLLGNWIHGEHHLIFLNCDTPETEAISQQLNLVRITKLNTKQISTNEVDMVGREEKVILLRPDGYIGFRGGKDHSSELLKYCRQDGLIRYGTRSCNIIHFMVPHSKSAPA